MAALFCSTFGRLGGNLRKRLVCDAHATWGVVMVDFGGRSISTGAGSIKMEKLLVANRGEIACRVITTARRLGIPTVAIYSSADKGSRHVEMANQAFNIGSASASDSYLRHDRIIDVAQKCGASAIHPGYGFLSEDAEFAEICSKHNIAFVGPPPDAIRSMGDKSQAKALMRAAGVPVVPGYEGTNQDLDHLCNEGRQIGYPILIKAVMGGGGKGMKLVETEAQLKESIQSAQREAKASFGDDRVLLEKFILSPRHIEVQVFADSQGNTVHLFERDCSVQRRHQKVLEESPGPNITRQFRELLCKAAVDAAKAVGYINAGTVEFIVDSVREDFYFMEMNTRLQVEHPVSEWVSGVDLVEWQLRVAAGENLPRHQDDITPRGHAIEARVYSELPHQQFLPGTGKVEKWKVPQGSVEFCLPESLEGIRVDSGVRGGDEVGVHYDPMIAKVIAGGRDRAAALQNLNKALQELQVCGLPTNVEFLQRILSNKEFASGQFTTNFIEQNKDQLLAPTTISTDILAFAAVTRLHLFKWQPQSHKIAGSGAPWDTLDARQLNGCSKEVVLLKDMSGIEHTLHLTMLSGDKADVFIERHGESVSVSNINASEDGSISAEVNGELFSADTTIFKRSNQTGLVLWMGDKHTEFTWSSPHWKEGGPNTGGLSGRILAPMHGRVVKVAVNEADEVENGALLVVLEAMKMEHEVRAPKSGKIIKVEVGIGGTVEDGSVLVQMG